MSTSNADSTGTTTALPTPTTSELKHTIAASTQPLPPAHVFQSNGDTPAANLLPTHPSYKAHGDIPNTPFAVSLISTILGGIFFTSLTLALLGRGMAAGTAAGGVEGSGWGAWARPQLGVYLACLAGFHLLEFWITAGWNPDRLSVDGESLIVAVYPFVLKID
jgi:hypothetical protein